MTQAKRWNKGREGERGVAIRGHGSHICAPAQRPMARGSRKSLSLSIYIRSSCMEIRPVIITETASEFSLSAIARDEAWNIKPPTGIRDAICILHDKRHFGRKVLRRFSSIIYSPSFLYTYAHIRGVSTLSFAPRCLRSQGRLTFYSFGY